MSHCSKNKAHAYVVVQTIVSRVSKTTMTCTTSVRSKTMTLSEASPPDVGGWVHWHGKLYYGGVIRRANQQ